MKSLIIIIFVAICFFTSPLGRTGGAVAQWQPDVRLTNDPGASYTSSNNGRCVAASGNIIHVAWADRRGTYVQIYYKRSPDGGVSWGPDTQLTTNIWYYTGNPSISVSGLDVHVIWIYNHNEANELFYKRSTDGGLSWSANVNFGVVNSGSFISPQSSITASVSTLHVVWSGVINGSSDIYYKRSSNQGISWAGDIRLTNDPADSYNTSVSVFGQAVHVIWQDIRDGNWEIYCKRSTDEGISWDPDTRLTNSPFSSFNPAIAVSGLFVHAVWVDTRDGNTEIYYKRSADGGSSWGVDSRLTNNPDSSLNPSISGSGSVVHILWQDNRDGNSEIYYKRSTDGGISWAADTRLTNNSAESLSPSAAIVGSAVHVVWSDNRDGNYEIYYKRDPTGNPTGIKNINSEIPDNFSLSQNYPNPFNPVTKIKFDITTPLTPPEGGKLGFVILTIYNILGREVVTLVNEQLQPGTYEVEWNGMNYPSGVYFYKLITEAYAETRKMILIK